MERTPITPETLTNRRVATDQLLTALLASNRLDMSHHFATAAIKLDPDYPLNYYNLARTDAEQRDWGGAGVHLRQAFERKANTLPGEHMPDPMAEPAFIRLSKLEPFWNLVKALPRSIPPPALKARDREVEVSEFDLALPNHIGRLTLLAPDFKITESSAKPSGNEFGLRGNNDATSTDFLVFLFLYADNAKNADSGKKTDITASERCRTFILSHEKVSSPRLSMVEADPAIASKIPIALAEYKQGLYSYVRAFAAEGPLCADLSIYSKSAITSARQRSIRSLPA